jgi:cation:H+ antiporter
VFNALVIPAAATLSHRGRLTTSRHLVYKEAQFYMRSVATLLVTFAFAVIYNPVPGGGLAGTVTRPLALLPVALYGVYVFTQYQDLADHDGGSDDGVAVGRRWLELGAGVVLIVVAVEGLVRAAIGFGEMFGTPSFVWGMVVVAESSVVDEVLALFRG